MATPLFPEATVIGLAKFKELTVPFNVEFALPVESPIVITLEFAPKALTLVLPLTVPDLIVKPLVKVFTPESIRLEVAEFSITPVTFVPMIAEIVLSPAPEPELVIVPMWLTEVVERVIPAASELLLFKIKLPVPVVPPETVKIFVPAVLVRVVPPEATVSAVVLIVSAEVVEFSFMLVTFAPIPPEIVVVPVLVPEFVIVPVMLTEAVDIVMVPVVLAFVVKLPVPVMPPLTMIPPVTVSEIVRS